MKEKIPAIEEVSVEGWFEGAFVGEIDDDTILFSIKLNDESDACYSRSQEAWIRYLAGKNGADVFHEIVDRTLYPMDYVENYHD